MRTAFRFTLAAAALSLTGALPAAAQSTTRIETRPFYGATVTMEEGVRVFRPLPPEDHVIINPEGRTPVSLGFNETNVYEHRVIRNYNYNEGSSSSPRYVSGSYWGSGSYNGYGRSYYGHGGGGEGRGHHGGGVGGH